MMIFGMACQGDQSKAQKGPKIIKAPVNPNGDSQLALLMRAMYDDGMAIKKLIEAGKSIEIGNDGKLLFTAKATEPEKVQSEAYQTHAKLYIEAIEELQDASKDKKATYHKMIDACMDCHRSVCPGPMVKIKKMYMD